MTHRPEHAIRPRTGSWFLVFLAMFAVIGAGGTQTPEPSTDQAPDQVAVEALRCWRDLERRAVTVGAPFTMTITYEVVETDTATTIPDEIPLAPETIELPPFDVVDGQRFDDLRDGPYRFFQYRYTLRAIDDATIGQEVELPALELSYHIERRVDGGAALPGRDVRYVLPAEPVSVLSLVPADSTALQDLQIASFGAADDRRFRANLTLLGAAATGLAAIGLVVVAALRTRQHRPRQALASVTPIPTHRIVGRALAELVALQRETANRTWTAPQTGRALSALRLAAAMALETPIVEVSVAPDTPTRDGQLKTTSGLLRRRTTMLSSSVTAAALARRSPIQTSPTSDVLGDLQRVLAVFTAVRYGRPAEASTPVGPAYSGALDKGILAVREIGRVTANPIRRFQHWRRSLLHDRTSRRP